MESLLLVGLVIANPTRINRTSTRLRSASMGLIAVTSLANAWSAGRLITALLNGQASNDARQLLGTGGAIWLTNVIVFALWYWELDRGGPGARANHERKFVDSKFPQMDTPEVPYEHLQAVAVEMNGCPRKVLGWRTPAEGLR